MELVKRVAILLLCSTATVTKTNGSSMGTIAKDWESHYAIRYDGERSYSRIGSVAQVGALGAAATGPGKSWSGYPESNTRRLHASWCVGYSDILTYCCGAEAKLDCEAVGGTYHGPEDPCEVVIMDVVVGPASCTGLTNSSGVINNCQCGEVQPRTGGAATPGSSLAPTPTRDPSPAPTALPTMSPTIISDAGVPPTMSSTMSPTSSTEPEATGSSGSWRAASPTNLVGVSIASCALVAAALAGRV